MALSDQHRQALKVFCESQMSSKTIKEASSMKKKKLNGTKADLRDKLYEMLGEHSCLKVHDQLYLVRKVCRSTVRLSESVLEDAVESMTSEHLQKQIEKQASFPEALVQALLDSLRDVRTTVREYADLVTKKKAKVDGQITSEQDVALVHRYQETCEALKSLNAKQKKDIAPLDAKIKEVEQDVKQYMREKNVWSQRVNIPVTDGITQSYYIRRKVSTKQPPLKAKEVEKLVHDAVSVLSTIVSYQSYVEHKGRMVATLINLFEEVPAVTTENISFDKGGMKRKKT